MKKLLAIFLFVCLIGPFAGTYLWLKVEQMLARKEAKRHILAGIDKKELTLLKFTKAVSDTKFYWGFLPEKEFEYKGEMYDLIESKIEGDYILYWCWRDSEETKLNKQLSSLVAKMLGNDPQNQENKERLIDFLEILYLTNTFNWGTHFSTPDKITFLNYSSSYASYCMTPPILPLK